MNLIDDGFVSLFSVLSDEEGAVYVSINPLVEENLQREAKKEFDTLQKRQVELIIEALDRVEEGLDD